MYGKPSVADVVATLPLRWPHHPAGIQIAPKQIHLWILELADFDFKKHCGLLLPAEYARAERIRDDHKRRLYLGGRMGLRALLCGYTGIAVDALILAYGAKGKPVLANQTTRGQLEFNYTLSDDKVLYGFALDRALGVDLEILPRNIHYRSMAARKLTAQERIAWQNLPPGFENDSMLCCWTRKEAYGKALGVGIRYHFNQVNLFNQPGQYHWRTYPDGLFAGTDCRAMPAMLEGAQIGLPFNGVAAIMYQQQPHILTQPAFQARRLLL